MDYAAKIFHDKIEDTPLAKSLADGSVDPILYREYLRNSLVVWESLEKRFDLARKLGVAQRIRDDLALTRPDPYEDESVHWRAELQASNANEADLYVLGLGLCFGGKMMARAITARQPDLPTRHMQMPRGAVKKLRELEPNSSGIASAFSQTLAWYSNAA
jgi:hypothetical protein